MSRGRSCGAPAPSFPSSRKYSTCWFYLVRNRDRIVSKDELIDVIWHGRIVSEAALSSCISAARRAVGDTGENQTPHSHAP